MYGTGAPVGVAVVAGGAVLTATNAPMMLAAAAGVLALLSALFLLRVVGVHRARRAGPRERTSHDSPRRRRR